MKITLDLDQLLQDQRLTPEEAERLRSLASPPPRKRQARGLGSVALWAALGLLLGSLFGMTVLASGVLGRVGSSDSSLSLGLIHGGLTGLLVGAAGGVLNWVFFPYERAL